MKRPIIIGLLFLFVLLPARVFGAPAAQTALSRLPLLFVENRGQYEHNVAYYVLSRDKNLYFTPRGVMFTLTGNQQRWAIALDFVNANRRPEPQQAALAKISYFKGPATQWKSGLSTYSEIVYKDLWPGIDLIYTGDTGKLKYRFVVRPGADPNQIQLAYRGVKSLRLSAAGQLEVSTPAGSFLDDAPTAFQQIGGRSIPVNAAYRWRDGAKHRKWGFELDDYDRSQALVIDPALVLYAGYIGGSGDDVGNAIAVDNAGCAYVAGYTFSSEASFPTMVGPDLSFNSNPGITTDAFVAKVNASGTALLYAGYIGGNGGEVAFGIAVDAGGNAYVTGQTSSSELTFPVWVGPDLTFNHFTSGVDAFVAKINPSGTSLVYAGYIGGEGSFGFGWDFGRAIAVDSSGSAYVAGDTNTGNNGTFPVLGGPDVTYNGGGDAFVAKVAPSGISLLYCGYIGGSSTDSASGIAVDSSGVAFVTGSTTSSAADLFPLVVGPSLTYGGSIDAFVSRIKADGSGLDYSGYVGGNGNENGSGIAIDGAGSAYITGRTTSVNFPAIVGPDLTHTGGGDYDAFVTKIKFDGTGFDYSGFIGGAGPDEGHGIAVDSSGVAYVTGQTDALNFPVLGVGAELMTHGGSTDAFVAKVRATGAALLYAGLIGGSDIDIGNGIAVDASGSAYIAGQTSSTQATLSPIAGPDLTHNGGKDCLVAKIGPSSICFGATLNLSNNSGGSFEPAISTSGQNVAVVWSDQTMGVLGREEIHLRISHDGGVHYDPVLNVSESPGFFSRSPQVAVSGDHAFVVWMDAEPGAYNAFARAVQINANGAVLGPKINLSNVVGGDAGYPKVVITGGHVYTVWHSGVAPNYKVMMSVAADSGVATSFPAATQISTLGGQSVFPVLAGAGNNAYAAWEAAGFQIVFRAILNNGTALGPETSMTASLGATAQAIAASGSNAYVVWGDNNGAFLRRVANNGSDFSAPAQNLGGGAGGPLNPKVVAEGGDVYVVWSQNLSPGNPDVFLARSTNFGGSFNAPQNLSTTVVQEDARYHDIAVSGSNVEVVWSSPGDDGNPGNGKVFARRSVDKGVNFAPVIDVSGTSGPSFESKVALSGTTAIVVWRDNGFGGADVFASWCAPDQASAASATAAGNVTFATSAGGFSYLTAVSESSLPAAGKPNGVTFPYGFFAWNVSGIAPGSTIVITITYPANIAAGSQYWKVINNIWTDVTSLLGDDDGDNVLTLTMTDGGLGDADGLVNGQIADPGGVGQQQSTASVMIDVRPGSPVNHVSPKEKGSLSVAVLSSGSFDASSVIVSSVRFGVTGSEAVATKPMLRDVNGDGVKDLVMDFDVQQSGIVCGTTIVKLTGMTTGGVSFAGTDSIVTVGCK